MKFIRFQDIAAYMHYIFLTHNIICTGYIKGELYDIVIETFFLILFSNSGCWSYVGRIVNSGQQYISLRSPGCVGVSMVDLSSVTVYLKIDKYACNSNKHNFQSLSLLRVIFFPIIFPLVSIYMQCIFDWLWI